MKKFFNNKISEANNDKIVEGEFIHHLTLLVNEMKKQGATDSDLRLIHKATVRNLMRNNREPEDVAWAILQ